METTDDKASLAMKSVLSGLGHFSIFWSHVHLM